jgi:hypothetical protein
MTTGDSRKTFIVSEKQAADIARLCGRLNVSQTDLLHMALSVVFVAHGDRYTPPDRKVGNPEWRQKAAKKTA